MPECVIEGCTVTYPSEAVFDQDRQGRWFYHDWRVTALDSRGGAVDVTIIPDRRDERLVCRRRHPQAITPTGRWIDGRRGKLLIARVATCEYCARMLAWRKRLEEYLAAGDVRGVLRGLDPGKFVWDEPYAQNLAEYLLCIGYQRSRPALPWDTDRARKFLDGRLPHPPDTNLNESLRKGCIEANGAYAAIPGGRDMVRSPDERPDRFRR